MSFLPDRLDVPVSQKDHTVLDVALREKVSLNHTCGGSGTCGTCRIVVVFGADLLAPRNEIEQELAESRGFGSQERLACQIEPVAGLVVEVPTPND